MSLILESNKSAKWSAQSGEYKYSERKLAQDCMEEGFDYSMYVGYVSSLSVDGKSLAEFAKARMPEKMYVKEYNEYWADRETWNVKLIKHSAAAGLDDVVTCVEEITTDEMKELRDSVGLVPQLLWKEEEGFVYTIWDLWDSRPRGRLG